VELIWEYTAQGYEIGCLTSSCRHFDVCRQLFEKLDGEENHGAQMFDLKFHEFC
jgi:hypothetical protein